MRLNLIKELISQFNRKNIAYCHWKSNATIERALSGDEDLDILVSKENKDICLETLRKLNFFRMTSFNDSWFSEIVHYYAYDKDSDKKVHLHLHFSLVLGHDLVKNYHLPVENEILKRANEREGVYMPPYELELILFAIRMTLKRSMGFLFYEPKRWMEIFLVKSKSKEINRNRNELDYLRTRSDNEILNKYLADIFPFLSQETFSFCLRSAERGNFGIISFIAGFRLKKTLRPYRRFSDITCFLLAARRYLKRLLGYVLLKLRLKNIFSKKIYPYGKIIALVGGDGSGKSTNVEAINSWFGSFIETKIIHIGRPRKGVIWYLLLPILLLERLFVKSRNLSTEIDHSEKTSIMFWYLIARYRYKAFERAVQFRSRGVLVCLDRFPISGINYMDCPRIRVLTQDSVKWRWLAKKEEAYYSKIRGVDEIIVLRLDPQIALLRRPEDEPTELLKRSGEIWEKQWFREHTHVIEASRPLHEVKCEIRSIIWKSFDEKIKIYELIGPAACGKSTISHKLYEETWDVQTDLNPLNYKLILIRTAILRLPFLWKLKKVTFKSIKILLSVETILVVLEKHKKKHILPCRVILLDDGLLVSISVLSLYYMRNKEVLGKSDWISDLYDRMVEVVDGIIYLSANDEILHDRLNNRSQEHRMKSVKQNEFSNFLKEYRDKYENSIEMFSPKKVFRIETQYSIEQAVKEVKSILEYYE